LAHNGPQEGDNPWHVSPHAEYPRPGTLPCKIQERRGLLLFGLCCWSPRSPPCRGFAAPESILRVGGLITEPLSAPQAHCGMETIVGTIPEYLRDKRSGGDIGAGERDPQRVRYVGPELERS